MLGFLLNRIGSAVLVPLSREPGDLRADLLVPAMSRRSWPIRARRSKSCSDPPRRLNLDQPWHLQMLAWFGNLLQGDLGQSSCSTGGLPRRSSNGFR